MSYYLAPRIQQHGPIVALAEEQNLDVEASLFEEIMKTKEK